MSVKEQLSLKDFKYKHHLGQNFITDTNLLKAIVRDAEIQSTDNVLEIGAGAGTLTREICSATTGTVYAIEVDKELQPILEKNLGEFKNLEISFRDILKVNPQDIKERFSQNPFKVVANLPYYISTPVLFYLLENAFDIKSITVMLQLEVARRLSAKPATKDYGALTVLLDLFGKVNFMRSVPRSLFTPAPKVDSAVIRIDIIPNRYTVIYNDIAPFIKNCFMMRRKTLANNLKQAYGIGRQLFDSACEVCDIDKDCRAEVLESPQFIALYKQLRIMDGLNK